MKTMDDLRAELFSTIADLRKGKLDTASAKTVAELGQTIINTAKAEADYARATGQAVASGLIQRAEPPKLPATPAEATVEAAQPAAAGPVRSLTATGVKEVDGHVTRHRLK